MTRAAKATLHLGLLTAVVLLAVMISRRSNDPPATELSAAGERGRAVFAAFCAPCHDASDPHRRGLMGPPVARSSKELLTAKVLRGEYPPGYRPKVASGQMAALPHLEGKLDDLAAFLAEVPSPAR